MKPSQDEKRRELVCWNKDAHAQSLRVELTGGSFHVFPYNRLQFARFEPGTDRDKFHVLFDTHEVRITGKNLRDLGMAFQRLAVEWVREVPARYTTVMNGDNPHICSFGVSEIQELKRASLQE
jgi:hypothetical protein